MTQEKRRYDLDWLRVLAILTVFIFHSGRFFDRMDWHVKNPMTHEGLQTWTMFLASWMMPLIFVISGASLYFALGKVGKFIKDKVLRLLVPLVVGVFTHVALGVYLERLTHHQFTGSFFEFYPKYFQGMYGDGGNFAWMGLHLWYLLVLFVFTLALMPVFYWLKGPGKKVLDWLGNFLALPGMFYLLALPVAWIMIKVNPQSIWGERAWGGWSLLGYILFFLYGFILFSNVKLQESIKRWRWVSLTLTIICTVALAYTNDRYGSAVFGSRGYTIVNGLFGGNAWLWSVSIFGFGMKRLNFQNRFLAYANEAVLPFYILHQTVLLCVGYIIVRLDIPDALKFIVIGLSSFVIIMAVYEFLIRRVNVMRALFGMKVKTRTVNSKVTSQIGLKV
ncbi:MAG: acyltransferase family protein [Anaerolineales bacterium]|nr:acyltransferase family protein [Anaerolineales bacterium]